MKHRIRWVRLILGALAVEAALLAVALPLNLSPAGHVALLYLVLPLCVAATFLGGWWVARRAESLYVVHGLLVGSIAALIYWGLTLKVALPTIYIVSNYMKLIGGAAGGALAKRNARRPSTQA